MERDAKGSIFQSMVSIQASILNATAQFLKYV